MMRFILLVALASACGVGRDTPQPRFPFPTPGEYVSYDAHWIELREGQTLAVQAGAANLEHRGQDLGIAVGEDGVFNYPKCPVDFRGGFDCGEDSDETVEPNGSRRHHTGHLRGRILNEHAIYLVHDVEYGCVEDCEREFWIDGTQGACPVKVGGELSDRGADDPYDCGCVLIGGVDGELSCDPESAGRYDFDL